MTSFEQKDNLTDADELEWEYDTAVQQMREITNRCQITPEEIATGIKAIRQCQHFLLNPISSHRTNLT